MVGNAFSKLWHKNQNCSLWTCDISISAASQAPQEKLLHESHHHQCPRRSAGCLRGSRCVTGKHWTRLTALVTAGESPKLLVCLCQPAFTDGNQTEVIVRPVPRPRSRLLSKPDVLNPRTNGGDAVTHSSSSVVGRPLATHAPTPHGLCHMMFQPLSCCQDFHIYEYPTEDLGRLRPVRPPPKPPVSRPGASDKPTAPLGRSGPSSSLNSEEVFGLCWIFHLI